MTELNIITDNNQILAYDPKIYEAYGCVSGGNETLRTAGGRTFLDEDSNIHVKSEYGRKDYEYFRRGEKISSDIRQVVKMSRASYDNVGIIKNTIDLMTDFAGKGMKIVHKNKKIQSFLRRWFKSIGGRGVNDRILQSLYRDGNVVVERADAKIKATTADRWKSTGFVDQKVDKMVIPYKYVVHNVLSLTKSSNEVLSDKPKFTLMMDSETLGVNTYTGLAIPVNTDAGKIKELDPNKIYDYYYKKSDWEIWAKPMTYAVINELMMLDKIELADMSALDGAISNVRLWRLGSLEYKIYPNREALNKLRGILAKNVGGGVLDLVWGPELEFKESSTQVHHFLGKEKYEAILTLIYAGLGIPPTLTGSSGTGTTNNFVSIKTLVERLEYGRSILVDFWEKQIDLVCRAMGFNGPARVLFTYNVLSDEAAEKAILRDMWDRDIVSSESIREAFGLDPEIEQTKISREAKRRGTTVPEKASPYHSPLYKEELKKIFIGSQTYSPSEFGIDLDPKKEKSPAELKEEISPTGTTNEKNHVVNPNGRPKNSLDTGPRKKRTVKPSSGFLNKMMWLAEAKEDLDAILNPVYVTSLGKENLRQITKEEYLELEKVKFHCLSNIKDFEKITQDQIIIVLELSGQQNKIIAAAELSHDFVQKYGRQPTIEETKQIYLLSLALE